MVAASDKLSCCDLLAKVTASPSQIAQDQSSVHDQFQITFEKLTPILRCSSEIFAAFTVIDELAECFRVLMTLHGKLIGRRYHAAFG